MIIYEEIKHYIRIYKENIWKKKVENCSINEIEKFIYDYNFLWAKEIYMQNTFYGIASTIKKFAGIPQENQFRVPIEHGINLYHESVNLYEIGSPGNYIVTMSKYRKSVIEKKSEKEAIMIGPYIAYAGEYYSAERMEYLKKQKGRTLLVFPTHSTKKFEQEYDTNIFIEAIERVKKDFNTVMVCMYWKDIALGRWKMYKDKGYEIVCAGHLYDQSFLNRLRTIFGLSDAVILNDTGTGLGYAVYLDKPCYIIEQNINQIGKDSNKSLGRVWGKEHFELLDAFHEPDFILTKQQKDLCSYIYGYDEVKEPKVLYETLQKCLKR